MAEKHFFEQKKHTTLYLVPYFEKYLSNFRESKILEVGCAEGGFLVVISEQNIEAVGLELETARVKIAKEKNPNLNIHVGDVTDDNIVDKIGERFDLIIMRDTIEHIPDRISTFSNLNKLLNQNGYLYITFPPKFSAFAGHQQNLKSILRLLPYLHILPDWIIRKLGKAFKEQTGQIEAVIVNYRVGLTVKAFEKYYSMFNFKPIVKELFLIRPIYKVRFDLSSKKIPDIPFFREIFATGCEYLLKKYD
jgi:2-polyprenyl-3-methyl-5-hydroxy-6-metoxy-1,4-benzoquinol methylase